MIMQNKMYVPECYGGVHAFSERPECEDDNKGYGASSLPGHETSTFFFPLPLSGLLFFLMSTPLSERETKWQEDRETS